jgi:P4 family phage/plasmid primase-like protien
MAQIAPPNYRNLGLVVFPCSIDKRPAVPKGMSWKTYVGPVPTDRFGIAIPHGITIIDHDSYKGATLHEIETVLGCDPGAINWLDAEIQSTPSGGKHYAFRTSEDITTSSNRLGLRGFDTRGPGSGYICSGHGYMQKGAGVLRLGSPKMLPILPISAQKLLVATVDPRPVSDVVPLRVSVEDAESMLRCIDPSCSEVLEGLEEDDIGRKRWIRIACAMKSLLLPFNLFNKWSSGELHGGTPPENYDPITIERQYKSLKPEGGINSGTLRFYAVKGGWKEDWSSVFKDKNPDKLKQTVTAIAESAADPSELIAIIEDLKTSKLSPLERQIALEALRVELKSAGMWSREMGRMIKKEVANVTTPIRLEPKAAKTDPVMEFNAINFEPLPSKDGPADRHADNANALLAYVFTSRLRMKEGRFYWWDGRQWSLVPAREMKKFIWHAMQNKDGSKGTVDGTAEALRNLTPELKPCRIPTAIYFKDCVVDVTRGTTHSHSPDNYNVGCLSVDYRPEAIMHTWPVFLDSMFGTERDGHERVMLLQEIMGYALIEDNLNLQTCIALQGASRAGKGIVLELLMEIMGVGNFGVATFSKLASHKMQSAFRNHRIMVDTEAKSPSKRDQEEATGFFNKLTSNEHVAIEINYEQEPWVGRLDTKFFIACNELPSLIDNSGATANRFVVLSFAKSFRGREDRTLRNRLMREKEAIAAWAAQGLARLLYTGGVFTQPESSKMEIDELRRVNQKFLRFVECEIDMNPAYKCSSKQLFTAYNAWARDNNEQLLDSQQSFTRDIKPTLLSFGIQYKKVRLDGERQAVTGFEGCRVAPRYSDIFKNYA